MGVLTVLLLVPILWTLHAVHSKTLVSNVALPVPAEVPDTNPNNYGRDAYLFVPIPDLKEADEDKFYKQVANYCQYCCRGLPEAQPEGRTLTFITLLILLDALTQAVNNVQNPPSITPPNSTQTVLTIPVPNRNEDLTPTPTICQLLELLIEYIFLEGFYQGQGSGYNQLGSDINFPGNCSPDAVPYYPDTSRVNARGDAELHQVTESDCAKVWTDLRKMVNPFPNYYESPILG